IWLGMSNSKVDVLTKDGIRNLTVGHRIRVYNRVTYIYADADNTVWCATDNGLSVFNGGLHAPMIYIDTPTTGALKSIAFNPLTHELSLTNNVGISRIRGNATS